MFQQPPWQSVFHFRRVVPLNLDEVVFVGVAVDVVFLPVSVEFPASLLGVLLSSFHFMFTFLSFESHREDITFLLYTNIIWRFFAGKERFP